MPYGYEQLRAVAEEFIRTQESDTTWKQWEKWVQEQSFTPEAVKITHAFYISRGSSPRLGLMLDEAGLLDDPQHFLKVLTDEAVQKDLVALMERRHPQMRSRIESHDMTAVQGVLNLIVTGISNYLTQLEFLFALKQNRSNQQLAVKKDKIKAVFEVIKTLLPAEDDIIQDI